MDINTEHSRLEECKQRMKEICDEQMLIFKEINDAIALLSVQEIYENDSLILLLKLKDVQDSPTAKVERVLNVNFANYYCHLECAGISPDSVESWFVQDESIFCWLPNATMPIWIESLDNVEAPYIWKANGWMLGTYTIDAMKYAVNALLPERQFSSRLLALQCEWDRLSLESSELTVYLSLHG